MLETGVPKKVQDVSDELRRMVYSDAAMKNINRDVRKHLADAYVAVQKAQAVMTLEANRRFFGD